MPNPDGTETAAEAAARVAAAGQTDTGTRTAADTTALREFLRSMGIPLPATQADLYTIAEELQRQQGLLNQAQGMLGSGSFLDKLMGAGQFASAANKLTLLNQQLFNYAGEMFGSGSSQQQSISYLLRPPEPSIQKLPTPEEFLGDFQNAFATHIEELRSSKQISNEAADFATNQLQSAYMAKYTAKLGELAKAGVSPYTLGEVTREQRGTAPGTPAGSALDAALGQGVTTPTTISGISSDVSKQASDIGTGVPQEFTAQARIKPLDFLQQMLSPTSIELAYAGSQYGAGKPKYGAAPAGWVSGSRRA